MAFLAAHDRAYLADQMGLGKSAQAIVAARQVGAALPLIVCPASATENWRREWEKWSGPGEPEITSYASLIRNGVEREPDLVVLDEAHYAKSPSAKRTRAALKLARGAKWAWLLSGTPMPNHPGELWPPVKYLWPGIAERHGITTAHQWLTKWCKVRPTPYGPKPYAVQNGQLLRAELDKIMIRRRLEDVSLELPPLRVDLHRIPKARATARALSEYEDMESDEAAYTSTLRRVLGTVKAEPVAKQIISELEDGAYEQIVVLYYHRDVQAALAAAFDRAGVPVVGFGGDTPTTARQEAIDAFQAGQAPVFLAQQTAAGVAINLTAATEIVLLEPAWSPEDNRQAIARIHRIGQDRPCRARIFALTGTLDEAVMGTLKNKVKMQREVLGHG